SLEWMRKLSGGGPGKALLVDWRGCGRSSAPITEEDMKPEQLAQDHLEILHHLKMPTVHVVGHSTGGLIALLAMNKKPTSFNKAVLLDPVGAKGIQFDDSLEEAFLKMAQDRDLAGAIVGGTILNNDPQ